MKIDKKELADRKLELLVELDNTDVKPFLAKAALKISQEVSIPGFRKGKVPYDILKQHVGEATIYEEAFYNIVNKTLPEIVKKENIDFVGQPKVDAEKIAPGNPVVYKVTFVLMPKIKLGDYKTLTVKKQVVKTDEEKVKKTLADLRKLRAQEKLVERTAKKDDKVEVDFTIKLAGVVIEGGQGKKYPIVIGEKKFIPGFEDNLMGLKTGETKNFKITFPKDYFEKKLADRECDVEAKVQAVYEITLPELNDEFAKGLNFKTWAELEKQIRDNINMELEQKEKERLELAILEEIISKSTFDPIPEEMLEIEIQKMMHEFKHNVENSGGKFADYLQHIKKTEDDIKRDFQPNAEKRIKTGMIAKAVAEAEKIDATDKEVAEEIEKTIAPYKDEPDMIKQFESEQYKRYAKNILINQKTFALLESFVVV
ncbi:MAG: trigger factor [Patescibacteria group bacterium]